MSVFIPNGNANLIYTFGTGLPAITTDLTIMCWGLLNGATPANERIFVTVEPNLALQTDATGGAFALGTPNNVFAGSVMNLNTWYHMAFTCHNLSSSAHNLFGYLNGQINVVSADTADTFTAYTSITVGNFQSASNTFPLNGNVRDVRVWTRALSAGEVVAEMRSVYPTNFQGLLAWYRLDTNLTYDMSGHGHKLTATNTGQLLQPSPFRRTYEPR